MTIKIVSSSIKGLEEIPEDRHFYLFDIDGTVTRLNVDWGSKREVLAKEMRKRGYGDSDLKVDGKYIRVDAMESLVLNKEGARAVKDLARENRAVWERDGIEGLQTDTEVMRLVRKLKGDGKRLGAISNNMRGTVDDALRAAYLGHDIFETVYGLDTMGFKPKPDTSGAKRMLKEFGLESENDFKRAILIGDNDKADGGVARALGLDYVLIEMKPDLAYNNGEWGRIENGK